MDVSGSTQFGAWSSGVLCPLPACGNFPARPLGRGLLKGMLLIERAGTKVLTCYDSSMQVRPAWGSAVP